MRISSVTTTRLVEFSLVTLMRHVRRQAKVVSGARAVGDGLVTEPNPAPALTLTSVSTQAHASPTRTATTQPEVSRARATPVPATPATVLWAVT